MPQFALPYPVPRQWSPAAAEAIEANFRRLFQITPQLGGSILSNGLDVIVPQAGDLIACLTNGLFVRLPISTSVQRVLVNTGSVPTWGLVDLTTGVTSVLPVTAGGTGVSTIAVGDLLYGSASNVLSALAKDTNATRYLANTGASNIPKWDRVNLANGVSGNLPTTNLNGDGVSLGKFLQEDGSWASPIGTYADIISQAAISWWARGNTVKVVGGTDPATVLIGSGASDNQTDSTYSKFTYNGTASGNGAIIVAPETHSMRTDYDFTLQIVMRTGSVLTNLRMYWGLSTLLSNAYNADSVGGAGDRLIMFRYSSVAGGNWQGYIWDGTTKTVTADVATIAASTKYILKIRKSGSLVGFSVNGGAEVQVTTNLPAAGTDYGIVLNNVNTNTSNPANFFHFSRLLCQYGS